MAAKSGLQVITRLIIARWQWRTRGYRVVCPGCNRTRSIPIGMPLCRRCTHDSEEEESLRGMRHAGLQEKRNLVS